MVDVPKASMYIWATIPEPYKAMGRWSFAKKVLAEAKVAISPGIALVDYGDSHVRFALIENEHRIKQAVRGIKEMFRKDGLLTPRAPRRRLPDSFPIMRSAVAVRPYMMNPIKVGLLDWHRRRGTVSRAPAQPAGDHAPRRARHRGRCRRGARCGARARLPRRRTAHFDEPA